MSDRVAKRPRVTPSEAEEEAMMKALLEGLTPSDFDITPGCSQATPPKAASQRSVSAKTPIRTSPPTTGFSSSTSNSARRSLPATSRTPGTRHVSIKVSPKRPSSPRKSTTSAGTDHMALLGLNQKAKVAASGERRQKTDKVLSPKRKTAPLPGSPLKESTRPQPLSSSLTHIFNESASIAGPSIKLQPPKTPTRDGSSTPPPKPIPSTPVIEDACLPPPSQESMYDDDWDLDALANMDEAELIKPVVQVS